MKKKYYIIRLSASFFFMGSIAGGFLAGAEYGKWIGWATFVTLASVGLFLHRVAERVRQQA